MSDTWKDSMSEVERVALAAKSKGMTEFELFEAAYRLWYSREGGLQELEGHFAGYLLQATVPFWVRHFIRDIVLEYEPARDPSLSGVISWITQIIRIAALIVSSCYGLSNPRSASEPAFTLLA